MSTISKHESWMDSYEDLEQSRSQTLHDPTTSTIPATLEPIVVNTAAARQLLGGIDEKTLRDWRNQGHLNGAWFKLGGKVMFYVAELRQAMQRLCNASALTDCS